VEECPPVADTLLWSPEYAEPHPLNLDDIKKHIRIAPTPEDYELYKHTTGKLVLKLHVTLEGQVDQYCIAKPSGNPFLDKSITDQLGTLRFEPGTLAGKPVASWVVVPFQVCLR
jgi:TonB family protein